ncbi:MAG: GTP pyrophosphokinase family protein [Coriobacteriales bacterium]|nr:GTP pyrophosphokinase family protein [Coriobacteriales bacterium]
MDDIYGTHRPHMEATLDLLVAQVKQLRAYMIQENDLDPIEHILARIKSDASMREKCRRRGLPENAYSALNLIHDALGVRIVCAFLSDVYSIRDQLKADPSLEVIEERDYIRHAKPNGYRSYHLILRTQAGYFAEIQLRTISMDTWAALEHHLSYKKAPAANQRLIAQELKRCADELASTDVSMQTIRDMIVGGNQ